MERLTAALPDVRFGQMVANLSYATKGPTNEAIWEVEDAELLDAALQQLDRLERHAK